MPLVDFIKFRICSFKLSLLSAAELGRTSAKAFPALIASSLESSCLSIPVDIFISYITNAKTPAALLKRFDDSAFFINSIGSRAATQTQQEYARELLKIISRQREVLILSFIRFWSQTGNMRALKKLMNYSQKLSYSLRSYLKHELLRWDIYMYCSVRFPASSRTYYYISDDSTLCVGDAVSVPVGDDNILTPAEIVKIERYTYDNVPLPLCETKKIHSRIE